MCSSDLADAQEFEHLEFPLRCFPDDLLRYLLEVAGATVKMSSDGSVVLLTGTVEIGQGSRTALSQVVAEELAMPLEQITVAQLDTDVTPYDMGTLGSRSLFHMGHAVRRAAEEARESAAR